MDDKLFKQKLSEVAEWMIRVEPDESTVTSKKKRGPTDVNQKYMAADQDLLDQDCCDQKEDADSARPYRANNTCDILLVRVKPAAVDCDDCGRHCASGRHKEKKLYKTNRKENWREKCVTCGLHQNPFTGEFDVKANKASYVWADFLRVNKGAYMTEKNQAREQPVVVIRSWPETEKPL